MAQNTMMGTVLLSCSFLLGTMAAQGQSLPAPNPAVSSRPLPYLGFDKNEYPGDASLATLRTTFRFTGFWLNNPPQELHNSWTGKRAILKQQGFGFLLLFNGRIDAQLNGQNAAALGAADGQAAVAAAAKEGFPQNSRIFLDQEEGGRLLAEQAAYLFAWVDAVRNAGDRAGVYCSGIQVPDGSSTVSTAQDVVARETARHVHPGNAPSRSTNSRDPNQALALWIVNDQCPPSPGCSTTRKDKEAALDTNLPGVAVWQFALTPRRTPFAAGCPSNYDPDKSCYAPGYVDLAAADSPDPSSGR